MEPTTKAIAYGNPIKYLGAFPFLFFIFLCIYFFSSRILGASAGPAILFAELLVASSMLWLFVVSLKKPQIMVDESGFQHRNDPVILWPDIEKIELNSRNGEGFGNMNRSGLKLVLKNNKTLMFYDDSYKSIAAVKSFIRDEIILKSGLFPELQWQYENNIVGNPQISAESLITDDEWIYFEHNSNLMGSLTTILKVIVGAYMYPVIAGMIAILLYSVLGRILPIPVIILLAILLFVAIAISNIYSVCNRFAISKEFFCVQNYFSLKNYKYLNKKYTYAFNEIQEVVFTPVKQRQGSTIGLKVVLTDYSERTFYSQHFKKENWWAVWDALEARGVNVRNEIPTLSRDTPEMVEMQRAQSATLIDKFKALPAGTKVVIIWLASALILLPILKIFPPVQTPDHSKNVCANDIPAKSIFLDIQPSPGVNDSVKAIGDTFGGGIVAYILQAGDAGYDANVKHGLIITPFDLGSYVSFGSVTTKICACDTAIGTGKDNTDAIIATVGEGNSAAKVCKSLEFKGFKDWFLPSKKELDMVINNRKIINDRNRSTGLTRSEYWSSTVYTNINSEDSPSYHFYPLIYTRLADNVTGGEFHSLRNHNNLEHLANIRAVRAF